MKKIFALLILAISATPVVLAQKNEIRPRAIGISFTLHDYATAEKVRSTSISSVIAKKEWGKFKQMSPGIAITYFKGLKSHIDFSSSLAGAFVDYALPGRTNSSGDAFLLEADASLNFKLFSEKSCFTPYASIGLGASKYKVYYGAFIPVGAGLKINIFDEAGIFINSQYRIPVTSETSSYHFMHSIGFSGVIGGKN
jgi:hypothetical protein